MQSTGYVMSIFCRVVNVEIDVQISGWIYDSLGYSLELSDGRNDTNIYLDRIGGVIAAGFLAELSRY